MQVRDARDVPFRDTRNSRRIRAIVSTTSIPNRLLRRTGRVTLGLPRNAATGRVYSGIDIVLLWGASPYREMDLDPQLRVGVLVDRI